MRRAVYIFPDGEGEFYIQREWHILTKMWTIAQEGVTRPQAVGQWVDRDKGMGVERVCGV
jgi:hypothetical protein